MKAILSLLLLLPAFVASAQLTTHVYWTENTAMPASEVIYYKPEKKLAWADFKGAHVPDGIVAAVTMSGFGYKAELKGSGNTGQLNISVYCYFSKLKSWVKPDKKTAYILNHEQHHFNISFIAASLFVSKLRNANITLSNHKTLLPEIYRDCLAEMSRLQDAYDNETKNGQLKDIQAQWDKRLEDKLLAAAK